MIEPTPRAVTRSSAPTAPARPEVQDDPERARALASVRADGRALRFVPRRLRRNPEVVLAAVSQDGTALEYAAEPLRSDRAIVLAAVRNSGAALEHATARLRGDPEVVLAAFVREPESLRFATPELRADPALVLAALRAFYAHHDPAPRDLDDEAMLTAAVTGRVLPRGVLAGLMDNKALVLAGLRSHRIALASVSRRLQQDREVVLAAVTACGYALEHAPAPLQDDREVVLAAVASAPAAIVHASRSLRADREVILTAIERDPARALDALRVEPDDRTLALLAVRQDGAALAEASPRLRADPTVVLEATRRWAPAIRFAARPLRYMPPLSRLAAAHVPGYLDAAPEDLRDDPDIVAAALVLDPDALSKASPRLAVDPELLRLAARRRDAPASLTRRLDVPGKSGALADRDSRGRTALEHILDVTEAADLIGQPAEAPRQFSPRDLAEDLFRHIGTPEPVWLGRCYARTSYAIWARHRPAELCRIVAGLALRGQVTLASGLVVHWRPEQLPWPYLQEGDLSDFLWGRLVSTIRQAAPAEPCVLKEDLGLAYWGELANLHTRLTGQAHVEVALEIAGRGDPSQARARVREILERTGPVLAAYGTHGGSLAELPGEACMSLEGDGLLRAVRAPGYFVLPRAEAIAAELVILADHPCAPA